MKMCESAVYLLKDGKEEKILDGVSLLENREGQVRMVNIFGEEREIEAQIKVLSLVEHKIILEQNIAKEVI
jgi:predicted RNA-binding protein